MDKISINLLPREVLEKRKAEQRLTLLLLGLVLMVGSLALVYGYNFIRISQETATLDTIKAENQRIQAQISKIADFEQNKNFVDQREQLVNGAISKKYSWSRFLNNLSLIVPNEVWLKSLTVEAGGIVQFSGSGLAGSLASGTGHKTVAKWLVHLAELKDIDSVWLTSSSKTSAAGSGSTLGPTSSTNATLDASSTVDFETSAKIKSLQPEPVSDPSAPAPPAPGGNT